MYKVFNLGGKKLAYASLSMQIMSSLNYKHFLMFLCSSSFLENANMSYIKSRVKTLKYSLNIVFMKFINLAGELVCPKGITRYSYWPKQLQNADFQCHIFLYQFGCIQSSNQNLKNSLPHLINQSIHPMDT